MNIPTHIALRFKVLSTSFSFLYVLRAFFFHLYRFHIHLHLEFSLCLSMAQISPTPSLSPTLSIRTINCHDGQFNQEPATSIDFNVMVIVAAMLCALVCALGLNSMLRCVFQCTHRAVTEPRQWVASRRLNSGLKRKEMVALPTTTYANSTSSQSPSSATSGCPICLLDFHDGDEIRVLPKCNHRFHIVCIDKWLLSHSSCPTCRHRLKHSNASDVPSLDEIVTAL